MLQSPFTFLSWEASTSSLIVSTVQQPNKRWSLISIDGVSLERIIAVAKAEEGDDKWLENFAVMFPNFVLIASPDQSQSFLLKGSANLEVEDLDTHEIEELSDCEATQEAYESAVATWAPELPKSRNPTSGGKKQRSVSKSQQEDEHHHDDDEDGDGDEEDEADEHEENDDDDDELPEKREAYIAKRNALKVFEGLIEAGCAMAVNLNLTPKDIRDAFLAAGGKNITPEDEIELTDSDPATGTYLQEAAAGQGQQCPQQ